MLKIHFGHTRYTLANFLYFFHSTVEYFYKPATNITVDLISEKFKVRFEKLKFVFKKGTLGSRCQNVKPGNSKKILFQKQINELRK